jgi:quinoprotein glucose dehydrogenase
MVGGVLYTSTAMSQVAAIEAATGKTLWVYDPETWRVKRPTTKGFQHRGVAYWREGREERIFIATADSQLIALDARTGKPIPQFGAGGEINLRTVGLYRIAQGATDLYGHSSAPIICRDVVIVGSYIKDRGNTREMPPGDVRGFDVRTGKLLWAFHTVPQAGEFGNETWLNGSWKYTGNTNVWAPMSADDELGYVYLPVSTPTNNFFGGERPGDGLFGESLVCLEAKTGKRVWHFQMVHHGVWDYDPPAAPNLIDIKVGGRRIKAVAQVTKQGFCYVFDRVTGKPVWPIVERPVPQSQLADEKTAPTQPFPTKPPAFERQGVTIDDLIDFTPELRAEAVELLKRYDYGPLFTPPGKKPTIILPGVVGGANWTGAAVDPETAMLYVPSITLPLAIGLDQTAAGESDFSVEIAGGGRVDGPRGLPLLKPPYGRITAIDLNKGEIVWMTSNGDGPRRQVNEVLSRLGRNGADVGPLGGMGRAGPLLTKTLLFVGEGPHDPLAQPMFRAYDKATGKVVWEFKLESHVMGAPMTYVAGVKQYIVVACGFRKWPHELVALSLP